MLNPIAKSISLVPAYRRNVSPPRLLATTVLSLSSVTVDRAAVEITMYMAKLQLILGVASILRFPLIDVRRIKWGKPT